MPLERLNDPNAPSQSMSGFDNLVSRAVAAYQPAWIPPAGEIAGLVVVLDPLSLATRESRRQDQVALLTLCHLYHLIQRAGGVPVLTRADERYVVADAEHLATVREFCRRSRCHLLVQVGCGIAGLPAGAAEPDVALAAGLSEALSGVDGISEAHPVGGYGVPAASVCVASPPDPADPLRDRAVHRKAAEELYKAIARFAIAHRAALDSRRREVFPESAVAASQPIPYDPSEPRPTKIQRVARQIWPNGTLPAERAAWFCEIYRRVALSDRTIVHFEPRVQVEGGRVVLNGTTSEPRLIDGLIATLQAVGVEAISNIRVLPDSAKLGERCFGACAAAMARTFREAGEWSSPQTELLYGEPVLVLDREPGFLLIQAGDGYWGWVPAAAIRLMSRDEYRRYVDAEQAVLLQDVPAEDMVLRSGSRLPVASNGGGVVKLLRPDGRQIEVSESTVHRVDASAAEQRVRAALSMLYMPYVYGGRAPIGLDCSGMVTNVADQTGQAVARDAAQQFLAGKLVATRWYRDDIRAGDAVYFMDETGKIFHTGLAVSRTHFVHCSPPEVQISSFVKGERLYEPRWDEAFVAAKRW